MIEALSNLWFVIFVMTTAMIHLAALAIETYIKERKENNE